MTSLVSNLHTPARVAVIGASGGIGTGFVHTLAADDAVEAIYTFSRKGAVIDGDKIIPGTIDLTDPASIAAAADIAGEGGALDMVLVASGILHDEAAGIRPEKSVRDLSADAFAVNFAINATGPALVAQGFIPKMRRDGRAVFAALTARVGSISDNEMGGWYAYRASKAAANMIIKNIAIEVGRRHKQMIVAALQPGTVDTQLSKPFQSGVAEGKLFTPDFSATSLLKVLDGLEAGDSGSLFDWQGTRIAP